MGGVKGGGGIGFRLKIAFNLIYYTGVRTYKDPPEASNEGTNGATSNPGALISGFFGVVAAGIGGATLLLARRFNVDFLRYEEERKQVEREAACSHSLVVSKRTNPFCDKCGKIFSQAEAARQSILTCSHSFDIEMRLWQDSVNKLHSLWVGC